MLRIQLKNEKIDALDCQTLTREREIVFERVRNSEITMPQCIIVYNNFTDNLISALEKCSLSLRITPLRTSLSRALNYTAEAIFKVNHR